MRRVFIRVYGRVQGVFFRSCTQEKAEELGLTGWVKNEDEGTVVIVAEGEEEKIGEFKSCIHAKMPFGIHVDKLEELERKEIKKQSFAAFSVAY